MVNEAVQNTPPEGEQSIESHKRRPEAGYVMAMTAMLMIPMLIFAAFATDVGAWYVRSQQVQRASDAASLAAVVWMPDIDRAAQAALEVAKRNGFEDLDASGNPTNTTTATAADLEADFDAGPEPQVRVVRTGSQQIRVDIRAEGEVYFGKLVMDEISIERFAVAEYLLPVPMGNPTSALGTGVDTAYGNVDNFWLTAMPTCERRINGDFIGAGASINNCDGGNIAVNYEIGGHTFVVDVPADASGNASQPWVLQARLTCFVQNRGSVSGSGPTATQTYNWSRNESNAPMRFSTYAPDNTPLNDFDNIATGTPTVATVNRPSDAICGSVSNGPNSSGGQLNDWRTDLSAGGDPAPWVTIADVGTPGRWVMQAKNPSTEMKQSGVAVAGSTNPNTTNWALYSLRVVPLAYANSTTAWACTRVGPSASATCPNVYGAEFVGVHTSGSMFSDGEIPTTTGLTAELYLAEIDDIHRSKTIEITMFDPADGIEVVKILDPQGNAVDISWETIDVSVYNYTRPTGGNTYSADYPLTTQRCGGEGCITENRFGENSLSSQQFNFQDRTVRIYVPLPDDYSCKIVSGQPKDCWWKVKYIDQNANATEKTTWGVRLIGDPVRLIE